MSIRRSHWNVPIDAALASIAALRMGTLSFAILLQFLLSERILTDADGLVAYTVLLSGYLFCEIWNHRMTEKGLSWMNPAILASLFTFMLQFGMSNVLFFLPEEFSDQIGVDPVATPWMNHLMLLVVLAAITMWVGYDSRVAHELGRLIQKSELMRRWVTQSTTVNRATIYACISISVAARLLMISLGVYGYSSDVAELFAGAAYTQYLTLAESLGQLALLAVAIEYFSNTRQSRNLLFAILGCEVMFGFLSGFKSQVFMPFIVTGLAFYSQRHRMPRWMLPAVLLGIFAAYAVIEPFRDVRNHDTSFDSRDILSIASTMTSAGIADDHERPSTTLSLLARLNMTYVASKGIEYAATTRLTSTSPDFLADIFLAPAHAFIPRFLWEGKPFQSIGFWYTVEVMGYGLEDGIVSSTGMGPITYLNFAGGPLAVMTGFFVVGILQRILVLGTGSFGGGGFIVFFGILRLLVLVDSAFNTILVSMFRLVPLLIVAQHFLFSRASTPKMAADNPAFSMLQNRI